MAIIATPAKCFFDDAQVTLMRSTTNLRSRYTGKRQVLVLPYAVWLFRGNVVPLNGVDPTEAAAWRAFLVKLRGRGNSFRLKVPGVSRPTTGYAGPNGKVNGAGQTGLTLVTDGWTNSAAVLNEGDYFTVNDELKIATAPATANASGQVTISFEPELRSAPADNADVIVFEPHVLLSAERDDQASWRLSRPVQHAVELRAMEALDL